MVKGHKTLLCHVEKLQAPVQASSSGEPDASQTPLSLGEARKILGIPDGATFEQTVQAKNRLLSKAGKDSAKQTQASSSMKPRLREVYICPSRSSQCNAMLDA